MNVYITPVCTNNECYVERVRANSFMEAEDKFVKIFADQYECVDFGGSFADAQNALYNEDVVVGEIYDIEEF